MEKEPKSFLFRLFTDQKKEEPVVHEEFSIPATSKGKIFSLTDKYGIVWHFFGVPPEEKKKKDMITALHTSKAKIFSVTDKYGIVRHFFGVPPEEKKIKDGS